MKVAEQQYHNISGHILSNIHSSIKWTLHECLGFRSCHVAFEWRRRLLVPAQEELTRLIFMQSC